MFSEDRIVIGIRPSYLPINAVDTCLGRTHVTTGERGCVIESNLGMLMFDWGELAFGFIHRLRRYLILRSRPIDYLSVFGRK